MSTSQSDKILFAMKLALPTVLIFMSLSIGLSHIAYADDLAVSEWPWKISALMALLYCLGILFIYVKCRGTNALWAYGLTGLAAMLSLYYFFGICGYFCFFIFAPINAYLKWPALVGGIVLTVYWMVVTHRNVMCTIRATPFVERAFEEHGDCIQYQIPGGMQEFERRYTELNPFPKFFVCFVYGIAPFYLILNRVLSSSFGTNGVLLFLAVLGMPMSLWLAGAIVRSYLVMVALPLRIEKERHKRVVVIG